MFRLKLLAVGCMLLLATGCATYIQLQIKRAPEINLVGIKSVKIEPFNVTGRLRFDYGGSSGGLMGAVMGMAVDAGVSKIEEGKHPAIQQMEWDALRQKVYADGFYKLNEGGEFDAKVTGSISYDVSDSGEVKSYKDKDGNVRDYYELTRSAHVSVKFTIADKSGAVLGVSEVTGYAEKNPATRIGKKQGSTRRNGMTWSRTPCNRLPTPFCTRLPRIL